MKVCVNTPLHDACRGNFNNNIDQINQIINNGGALVEGNPMNIPQLIQEYDGDGFTPIHLLLLNPNLDDINIQEVLLILDRINATEGTNLNTNDSQGRHIFRLLIDNQVNPRLANNGNVDFERNLINRLVQDGFIEIPEQADWLTINVNLLNNLNQLIINNNNGNENDNNLLPEIEGNMNIQNDPLQGNTSTEDDCPLENNDGIMPNNQNIGNNVNVDNINNIFNHTESSDSNNSEETVTNFPILRKNDQNDDLTRRRNN